MGTNEKKVYIRVKRVLDILISLSAIVFLAPLFFILILAIKLDSKGPAIFKQKRVGKNKSDFYIYKFRTMREDAPNATPTHLLDNPEKWITRVGRFLRKTSLDELPQLINILRGDMSLVGPRPALWNQYDLISERDKYGANSVLPGLTGWAQVNGRDELSIEEKAKLDGEYVEKISFYMDLVCVLRTIISVIRREGIVEGCPERGQKLRTVIYDEIIQTEKQIASSKELIVNEENFNCRS